MEKIDAFWDASAIVPLCTDQGASLFARTALECRSVTVWWATPVEVVGAFCRLLRLGEISREEFEGAVSHLRSLQGRWMEVVPAERVRQLARGLVESHPLRAADALQLAAAVVWSAESPRGRLFVCLDQRLAAAAAGEGFEVLTL